MSVAVRGGGRKQARQNRPPRSAALLAWYDRHRRKLPWRALPGETPDPYRVWLSEIMLQQTTVKAVVPYFERFIARWPVLRDLAAAPTDDVLKLWAGLGYYARARNLQACAKAVVERHGGCFPRSEEELAALPGIGHYTAGAIAAIAFGRRAAAVDGNVERVLARVFAVEAELPSARAQLREMAEALVPRSRPGDFAQALMDLGATICTPRRPACALCPWRGNCRALSLGDPEAFPRRARRRSGPLRRGAAFVAMRRDGAMLVRSRPPRGLLAGMTELPTTDWTPDFEESTAALEAPRLGRARPRWKRLPGTVSHVFTHFPLELAVYAVEVGMEAAAPAGTRWLGRAEVADAALPTLMRKVLAHALGAAIAKPGPRDLLIEDQLPRRDP